MTRHDDFMVNMAKLWLSTTIRASGTAFLHICHDLAAVLSRPKQTILSSVTLYNKVHQIYSVESAFVWMWKMLHSMHSMGWNISLIENHLQVQQPLKKIPLRYGNKPCLDISSNLQYGLYVISAGFIIAKWLWFALSSSLGWAWTSTKWENLKISLTSALTLLNCSLLVY